MTCVDEATESATAAESPEPTGAPAASAAAQGPPPAEPPVHQQAWACGTRFSNYEIDSLLATGGMAEVWRARIKGVAGFEKRIVLKTMLPTLQHRRDLVEMFIGEAAVAARLSHPNVAHVFDFGEMDGRYFIAMEYVPGVTLRFAHKRMLAYHARLAPATVLHVLRDACEALHHLHELADERGRFGFVHRDMSPDNVIISPSGTTKLIDFGAVRATARTAPTPIFVGKYRYAAPERIRREAEDARSDVYSVGVILYECLTGARPFDGPDLEVMRAILASRACDPRVALPSLPESVAHMVMKATAQDARDRYATARELSAAIAACLADVGAASKERDVSESLMALSEGPAPALPPPVASAAPAATQEGVPELIDQVTEADSSLPEIVLSEQELIEASGPIRIPVGASRLAPPPPPVAPLAAGGDRAVLLFDRGIQLRAAGHYEEALRAWDDASTLAPENRIYRASAGRLREQIEGSESRRSAEMPLPPAAAQPLAAAEALPPPPAASKGA